jgi:Domain of unknown function (DUF222)
VFLSVVRGFVVLREILLVSTPIRNRRQARVRCRERKNFLSGRQGSRVIHRPKIALDPSVVRGKIEHMFGSEFASEDDATLVAGIEQDARAEAAAGARRLARIAELARRRVIDDDERAYWVFDGWNCAAAEVAAAMTIGHRRASGQMRIAVALRDRLPQVAALYVQGLISSRVVSTITWRTHLVEDAEALASIDDAIAERAQKWGTLSENKLDDAIDALVQRYDPAAVRHVEYLARTCDFTIGDIDDEAGVASVWGRLSAADAEVLKRQINAMVASVCKDDPRTMPQRRAAAVGALGAKRDHLACLCGSPTCPTAGESSASHVTITVIAEQSAVEAATTDTSDTSDTSGTRKNSARTPGTALILGGSVLPTPLLAELIRGGAKVRRVRLPGDEPEPRYRPSAALAEFVRMRDLYCRFPGCDVPADRCDIDHTVPFPVGLTHASNLKCECRQHHLMKTFYTGIGGWNDVQLPDGTVVWTSPAGRTYTTKPGSRLFFPNWNTTTTDLPPPPPVVPTSVGRALMMPKRRRTRAAEDAALTKAERAHNERAILEAAAAF